MAIITKKVFLETTQQNLIQAIIAKQSDCNSRFLKVTFLNEGVTIPLESSSKVTINAERKDGASKSFFGVVNEDNTATVPLHSWILELDGTVNCDISIIGTDESRLTTTGFVVLVEKAANSGEDISSDPQYDVLANLIDEVSEIKQDVANALKGTASGSILALKDVSPLTHEIEVKLTSDTITDFSSVSVTRQGKNILPYPYVHSNMSQGGITWTDNGDGTLTANGTPIGPYNVFFNLTKSNIFKDGVTYIANAGDNGVFAMGLEVYDLEADKQIPIDTAKPFTWNSSRYEMRILYIVNPKVETVNGVVLKPMVEVGTVATKFEPYQKDESISATADGTASITSRGESVTLLTDSENVTITAEYNRDINKAFQSLLNALENVYE